MNIDDNIKFQNYSPANNLNIAFLYWSSLKFIKQSVKFIHIINKLIILLQAFQSKLSFSSKEIVAISCSWCKAAYHNKDSCFNIQRIGEECKLGENDILFRYPVKTLIDYWLPAIRSLFPQSWEIFVLSWLFLVVGTGKSCRRPSPVNTMAEAWLRCCFAQISTF